MSEDKKPEHLKGWLDRPPLSDWSEEEQGFAFDAFRIPRRARSRQVDLLRPAFRGVL